MLLQQSHVPSCVQALDIYFLIDNYFLAFISNTSVLKSEFC